MFDRVLVKSKRNHRRKEKRNRPEQIDDIDEYYSGKFLIILTRIPVKDFIKSLVDIPIYLSFI